MLTKLRTLVWYLRQPKGLMLIWLLLKRKTLYAAKENTRSEAEEWCREHGTETTVALSKLFEDLQSPVAELEKAFPKEFSFARDRVIATPHKMGGQGNTILLYNVCQQIKARFVLETGVAYGWSSLCILLSLAKREGSLLVSTDMPYPKMGNENYVGIVVPPELKTHWVLIKESDVSGLEKALKTVPYLDVVHYDSDKSYLGRMFSYPKLYDKLRIGGVFISDDVNDNLAFKHFCEHHNKKPVVIPFEGKYVGVFIK